MTSFYAPNHLKHIAGLEERFGPVSDEVAVALRSLVRVICQYEDPIDAIPFLERCLAIEEALHGPEVTLSDLNTWIGKAGGVDFEYVEPLQLRRLAVKTVIFGETSREVAAECEALARRYASNGPYSKARSFLERSIAIKQKLCGAVSVEVATAVDLLAETSARLEKWKDAGTDLQRSLELKEKVFGQRSEEVARALLSSAIVYANASKLQRSGTRARHIHEAVTAFERGLTLLEERFAPDSLEVQKALEAMIRAYVDCREFWKAEPLLKRLLAICEQAYGDDAAALLWVLAELAKGYADESAEKAEPMLERSFAVLRTFLDAKKPIYRSGIAGLSGNREVLYGAGILEQLVQAQETFRSNLRKRWGTSG
ncbi:tetratricopeptide repeat protein [Bradyrhizobium sp. Ec3.3]|uniref:tetratricopeptide repeat protein n=1 Tax=Bradyrhizobium sp. Ec3.3 TaxID=189753 RepID=UPI00042541FD|nr:tetratricopeptide repeat protein [Bradyrhizobium sp. Ec3.3]